MFSNRLVVAVIGAGCIVAAGLGGYFASRQNTTPVPVSAAVQPASAPPTSTADRPVQETEAVVGEPARSEPRPEVAPKIDPKPEPARAGRSASESKRAAAAPESVPMAPRSMQAHPVSSPAEGPAPSGASSSAQHDAGQMPPVGPGTLGPSDGSTLPPPPPGAAPRAMHEFRDLVVSADSVIGLQTETAISTERARVEDPVNARVTRDVRVGSEVAIPAGSHALGSVTMVERGGKFKDRARLGIRFHTIVLADGTRLPISTDTLYREGEAPGNESAKKIGGGAVVGGILGAIFGGARGAVIGATAGGATGAGMVAAGDRSDAQLPAGSPVTVRLLSPVTVTIEK